MNKNFYLLPESGELTLSYVQVKATLLQLEVLEAGIEERLNAPPAPCLSCADWFLPAASAPVFSKLAGAVKGSSTSSRGRSLFGEKARRSSPQRSLSDSGSEGQTDAGSGSASSVGPGLSPHSTPDLQRKLGGRRDSLGSGGSDGSGGSGGLFKVHLLCIRESFPISSCFFVIGFLISKLVIVPLC